MYTLDEVWGGFTTFVHVCRLCCRLLKGKPLAAQTYDIGYVAQEERLTHVPLTHAQIYLYE